MKHRLKNLNGWHRLGIVLSVFWILFIFIMAVFEYVADVWIFILVISIPIIAGWFGTYCSLLIFRWVREGFRQNKVELRKVQRVVFLVGIGLIILMGIIPPWYYDQVYLRPEFEYPRVAIEAGYGFLFSPPPCPKSFRIILGDIGRPRIDIQRLFSQWILVAVAMGGILFVLRDFKKDRP